MGLKKSDFIFKIAIDFGGEKRFTKNKKKWSKTTIFSNF